MAMNKAQAGSMGGRATVEKHGSDHMREIGKRGAATFHRRYRLRPIQTNNFAIVRRDNGEVVSTMYGYHPTRRHLNEE